MERRWSTIDTIAAVLATLGGSGLIAAWVVQKTVDTTEIPEGVWVASFAALALAAVLFAVSLVKSKRAPKYRQATWPHEAGSHYFKLAREDGDDFGYAIARVYRRRLILPDVDEGEPTTPKKWANRGDAVTYCYPDHFGEATQPPVMGKYRVRWSVSPFDDPKLRPNSRTVKTTKFEITKADHEAAKTALETGQNEVAATPQKTAEPHDPTKDYNARLSFEISGQGRFRYLLSGLHDVGNGWDRGVEMEVVLPSGKLVKAGGWVGLDTPEMRRAVAQGGGARAELPGPYVIRWRNMPSPDYESEVIAEKVVTLESTGPRKGWTAHHHWRGEEIVFEVVQDSLGREQLRGFRCEVWGPSPLVPFEADDRSHEQAFGPPSLKEKGSFVFPQDFRDAPALQNLHDGDYTVYWTAWEVAGESSPHRQLDVARDAFHVTRDGSVE